MTAFLREELKKAVRASAHKPLVVCGAGVSIYATDGGAPSWANLIKSGIKRVIDLDTNAAAWAEEGLSKLTAGNTAAWMAVADSVTERLGGVRNAEFATWLKGEIGELVPTRRDLVDAIVALDCPIATTNYDDVLVKASGLHPINWSDHAATHEFLYDRRKGILHLHGHWQSPAHVILGSKSYDEHFKDERRRLLQDIAALDRPTIFIGCSQDGLTDPDFSRLDSFLTEWQDVAPRRYWLVRQEVGDEGKLTPLPSPDHARRLFPVSFGENYDDLVPLLRELPEPQVPSTTSADPDAAIRCIDQQEPKPDIFGRSDEIEAIVNTLLARRPVIVAGGPGMGKTAVAIVALYDPRIVSQFGRRRVFASLESTTEPRAILAKLADALGLPPNGDEVSLLRTLEANAAEHPVAAVLDNAETVFEAGREEAERLLKLVAQINGLSLIVTVRGVGPSVPGATLIEDLPKLAAGPAREAFLAVAGAVFRADPDLAHLLDALDGHALSIQLVAAQAIGLSALKGLRESWDEAHAEILRQPGTEESRLTSVRASLALTLNSRRLKSAPLARRLTGLLSYLPGGLAETDVQPLLGERGALTRAKANEAITCLHQLRLVERRPDRRLRMLTPLRECVKRDVPAIDMDRKRLVDRYLALTARAKMIGRKEWDQVREEIEVEIDNLDPVCELAVATNINHRRLSDALGGLSELYRFSSRGTIESLKRAAVKLRARPPSWEAAHCIEWLGRVAVYRTDAKARSLLEEARELHRRVGGVLGEANCTHGLGEVAFIDDDMETALARYNEALLLYRRIHKDEDGLSEANCILGLGDIAFARSDLGTALRLTEEALAIYRRDPGLSGQASCIRRLGLIAFSRSDYQTAHEHIEEAMAICRQIGTVAGEAACVADLGRIAFARSDHETAQASFEAALGLSRRIGSVRLEASFLRRLGQLSLWHSDYQAALIRFGEALSLSQKASDTIAVAEAIIRQGQAKRGAGNTKAGLADIERGFSIYFSSADAKDLALPGWHAMSDALKSDKSGDISRHLGIARSTWAAIGRLDLVHDWVDQPSSGGAGEMT